MNPNAWTPEEESKELKKAFTKRALPIILFILIGMDIFIGFSFILERHWELNFIIQILNLTLDISNQIIMKLKEVLVTKQRKIIFCCFHLILLFGLVSIILVLILLSAKQDNFLRFGMCISRGGIYGHRGDGGCTPIIHIFYNQLWE